MTHGLVGTLNTPFTYLRNTKVAYIQLKELHKTANAAATDLFEMQRQYNMAVRNGNNEEILSLAHGVKTLETAYELLLDLIENMERKL